MDCYGFLRVFHKPRLPLFRRAVRMAMNVPVRWRDLGVQRNVVQPVSYVLAGAFPDQGVVVTFRRGSKPDNQMARAQRRSMARAQRQPTKAPYRDRHGHRGVKRPRVAA